VINLEVMWSLWQYKNGIMTGSHNTLWVYCHYDMACPQVVDGGDSLQSWVVAAGVLNRKSQTVNKGGPPFRGSGLATYCN
jgi:hypothetical protein